MHALAPVINNIAAYQASEVVVDGCRYHEGLNIVHCESGVATNTIPDEAWMFVNFRFAPDRSIAQALEHLLEVLDLPEDVDYSIDDAVPGARPGLDQPIVAELIAATGGKVRAKYGRMWRGLVSLRFRRLILVLVIPALPIKRMSNVPPR